MFAFRLAAVAALALALGSAAGAQPASRTIDLANFSFSPNPIRLAAGQPVTLTFVNRSGSGHDFTAKAFFAGSRIAAGAAPGGKVALRGGETKSITLVPSAGTYEVHCSHFLHSSFGMTDQIVVN
jgi:plastocyanin